MGPHRGGCTLSGHKLERDKLLLMAGKPHLPAHRGGGQESGSWAVPGEQNQEAGLEFIDPHCPGDPVI